MSNYILKFGPEKGSKKETNFSVSSSSETTKDDASKTYLNVPNPPYPANGNTVTFQLVKIHFEKAVYEPSTVTADIAVTAPAESKDFVFDLSELAKCFIGATVKLTSTTNIKDLGLFQTEIGTDYFVSNAKPSISQERGCHVELEIHSRDFLLTTTRFSRSYLSRKLGEDIIKGTLKVGGMLGACKVDYSVDTKKLRNTTATIGGKPTELIQPYHVQHNEDFYSFLSRIAVRHGEYLYFEGGKLTLGLDAETAAVPLDDKEKKDTNKTKFHVVREFEAKSPMANPVAAEPFYKNYVYNDLSKGSKFWGTDTRYKVGSDAAGKPITVDPKKVYFNENAFDEYFDVFSTGSESYPSSLMQQEPLGEIGITWFFTEFCPMIAEFTTRGSFFGGYALLRNVVLEMVRIQVSAAQSNNAWNDTYKKYVNIKLANTSEQTSGNKVNQFASFTAANNESNFMAAYYTTVREGEKAVAESTVKMKIVPGLVNVKVGSKVSYGGKEYFVTKVYGTMEVDASDTMYLEAVPVLKDEKGRVKMLPPYHKCYESAPVGPQTAVVADSNDPRFLNRVRLRYPWQSDDDPASPWVRVQTPFATEHGGFSFLPRVGDEVMVNYIDGNPDRPYVSGFLFNNRNMPSFFPYYAEREIRHENGSRIVLGRGSAASFFNSVIPGAGFVTPFLGPQMFDFTKMISNAKEGVGKMFGNVTLTDGYGMFEISGDTAKRQVRLNSAAGNITLDALTGITISAPLGDIKIRAKNIDIEAGNRINIVSGLNIKAAQDKKAAEERLERLQKSNDAKTGKVENAFKTIGDYSSKLVAEALVGKIDYSIVRSVREAICEPMDGTMKIKSYRYMQLEAGEGTAMDVDSGFHAVKADSMERFKLVDSLCSHVIMKTLANRLKEVKSFAENYKSTQEMHPEFWGDSVKDCDALIADASAELANNSDHVFEAEYFCSMTEDDIKEKCLQDDIEYEEMERLEEKTFIVLDGKFLVESIRKVAKILADPCDSKTFAKESEKLISLGNENKSEVIITAYKKAITADLDLFKLIEYYLELDDPEHMLKKFNKAWFRAAIYGFLCLEGDDRVLPADCNKLVVLNDKDLIEIKDEKWNAIIKKIKDALPDLLDVDHNEDQGHVVIRDNFREMGKAFVRQVKTPQNIWSETQKGRILISDGDGGKTLKTKADHSGWESKENNAHLAEIRSFLLSR